MHARARRYLWELLDVLTATVRFVKARPLPDGAPPTQVCVRACVSARARVHSGMRACV